MAIDLSDTVAAVTGAGRGLGRAYAVQLARHGASVVVNDVDPEAAEGVVGDIVAAGGRAVSQPGAVGPTATAEAIVDRAVTEFGRIDAMVSNAGVLRDRMIWKMSDEDFDAVVDVHLRGTFTCVRAAVQRMREQTGGGRIIVVGSPAGQRGNIGQTSYAASKAGIVGMMRTWAMECQRAGIAVNAVIPVAVTEMTKAVPAFREHITAWEESGTPLPDRLRRGIGLGSVDDAAGLVAFLASPEAAGISGLTIGIGGDKLSLWSPPREETVAYEAGGWDAPGIADSWEATMAPAAERSRTVVTR